ncbi:MAG: diguanylate cyclase [Nitrospirae bacterium]|nr:diguanylate cyclase [Nitrospirota bacterium]
MNKTRIMIVEDEAITGSYIQSTLENLGYIVTSITSTATEAIEMAGQDRPDLVLMDIQIMGPMDGIEAAHEIRMRFNIPVVYLTAHSDGKTLERAKITEPFGYVIKPFDNRELISNIEMALYKHKAEIKLKELAHYDSLTGLPNRTLFYDRLEQSMKQAKRNNKDIALLMIDLDGFKCINDRMGHDTGDLVLKEIAQRLRSHIRDSDTAARLGGDEFVVILTNLSEAGDAETVALKIIVSIGKPFQFKVPYCAIGASIGISFYPSDGYDAETLLKKADAAMYRVKEGGKNNYRLFNDINKKINGDIKVALSFALNFVIRQKGVWGHNDWLEFLIDLKENGFFISKNVEPYIGSLLETLKNFYLLPPPSDGTVEEKLSRICSKAADFIIETNGIWTVHEWKAFLSRIKLYGIELTEKQGLLFCAIVESVKSLQTIGL